MISRYLVAYDKQGQGLSDNKTALVLPGFDCLQVSERLQVFAEVGSPYISSTDANTLLFGRLFTRDTPPRTVDALSDGDWRVQRDTFGQMLIDAYWGGYTYVDCVQATATLTVVRDPSGALPCYWCDTADTLWLASDIQSLIAATRRPTIDWQAVRRHLYAYDLREARTCLTGIQELLPGHRLVATPDRIALEIAWSPWTFTKRHRHDAAQRLRETVDGCVGAWASCYDNILLNISGGLDSSICTAALRTTNARVTCLTMATDDAEGDERPYARLAATAFNRELIEGFHCQSDVDLRQTGSAHLPRPINYALAQSELKFKERLVREQHFDSVFTGVGGDNVFCNMPSATPIVDRFRAQGPIGALATLADVCRMTDASFGEAYRAAVKRWRNRNPAYAWHANPTFLKDPQTILPQLYHPWLIPPRTALPGQSVHIAMLLRVLATTDGHDPAKTPQQINPLVSQPIMELCLGIPSWQWCAGGRDRSVARAAYSDILPQALINRRSKGGAATFAHRLISENRDFLRPYLCAGELAGHEIVDANALTEVLEPGREIGASDYLRLLFLVEAESWARHWNTSSSGE
jgi:asparagine synthase (glutamine-hydrolysing)